MYVAVRRQHIEKSQTTHSLIT